MRFPLRDLGHSFIVNVTIRKGAELRLWARAIIASVRRGLEQAQLKPQSTGSFQADGEYISYRLSDAWSRTTHSRTFRTLSRLSERCHWFGFDFSKILRPNGRVRRASLSAQKGLDWCLPLDRL